MRGTSNDRSSEVRVSDHRSTCPGLKLVDESRLDHESILGLAQDGAAGNDGIDDIERDVQLRCEFRLWEHRAEAGAVRGTP